MKKRLLYLVSVALVTMLMLVPSTAFAQQAVMEQTTEVTTTAPLPPTGGSAISGPVVALPAAAALLLGAGVLTYAVVRRR